MPALQEPTLANQDRNLALFCDFENVALGVRDSKYANFDMRLVVQKLLVKGSIVVKKAYGNLEQYAFSRPVISPVCCRELDRGP